MTMRYPHKPDFPRPSAARRTKQEHRWRKFIIIGSLLVLLLVVIDTTTAHAHHAAKQQQTKQQIRKCIRASASSHRKICRALVVATRRENVRAWWAWNPYLHRVITRESGWSMRAVNRRSGACGIGQMLPCNKYGKDSCWPGRYKQASCLVRYVKRRYGHPRLAWMHHLRVGWY